MEGCRITVFTPAYNRAYIIEELYHSLQRQTFRDFEWVVVDDGSTDGTEELFGRILKEENFFSIVYYKKENGGKHRAINTGVSLAKGELFFIVDSDDHLTDDALERVIEAEGSIPEDLRAAFAGVSGKRGKSRNEIIGTTFDGEYLDITSLEREKHNITGDQAEVFYTRILREFPFPEFEGERFLTEAVVWDRIANAGYRLRYFNEIIYICEYLPDGLTSAGAELFRKNPRGYGLWLSQRAGYMKYGLSERLRLYYSFTCEMKDRYSDAVIAECVNAPVFVIRGCRAVNRLLQIIRGK